MKKLPLLALSVLAALATLSPAPLPALEMSPTAAPAVAADAPCPAIPGDTADQAVALPGALPFQPVNLSACTDLCGSEYNSCRLDCRFQPYPGCANDCWLEYQACLGGC